MQGELEAIAESVVLSGALEEAAEAHARALADDPEWSTQKYVHVATLVRAFAHGVLSADPWHRNYRLPPDFEGVVNWIAHCVQRYFGECVVPCLSLIEVEALLREWAFEHPSFVKWNQTDKLVGVTHRYSDVPDKREFIDLDALLRNAVVHIRDEHRRSEAFDAEFERQRIAEHGAPPFGREAA